ncbi:MAG: hypothetical protein ACRDL6_11100 [Solirubrobacterales bacterium]
MIHIATAHDRRDRWIEIQHRYLARHTHEPCRVYASLDGIDARYHSRFHQVVDLSGAATGGRLRQGEKLTLLAEEIARQAEPDDLLVFMHGDCFPIADWVTPVRRMLAGSPLAAVRRDENMEPIPHECFCATTPGFWTGIGGKWVLGPTWDARGRIVTDTGASLWEILARRGIEWRPILRTNARDPHPLWFAIYGGIVYHHGAGFREPMSRIDASTYHHLPVPLRNIAGVRRRVANTLLSRRMFRRIIKDERFYEPLVSGDA